MSKMDAINNKWQQMQPGLQKTAAVLKGVWKWVYRLRSIILATPVAIGAVVLAIYNQANLPDMVGVDLQATGEYAQLVSREVAVLGPLAVTAVCLLLMFCSRKVLYPWLISVFSLALPVLLLITNIFPG